MADRKYPIHKEAGVAWVLVFDARASKWLVEETRSGAKARVRIPLAVFEASEAGKSISRQTAAAVALAERDA